MALRLLAIAAGCALISAPRWSVAQAVENASQGAAPVPAAPDDRAPAPRSDASAAAPSATPHLLLPKLTSDAEVPYPTNARGAAEVILELVVDRSGRVVDVDVIRGDAPFGSAAERAAGGWQFEPATRDGSPVVARIRFLVRFEEPDRAASSASPSQGSSSATSGSPEPSASQPPAGGPVSITVLGQRTDHAASLTKGEVRQLPGAFGDAFRAIEALPGVTPFASGIPYFFVRGAPPGNVGYFFDGVRMPVLFHAAAGPAVIAPWFVDEVKLYPGGYPARYGRFAGGVVTADAAEPTNAWRAMANVRVFDASAMVEAPFAGGRGNVIAGGRYSYSAAVFSLLSPGLDLGYWDYQARAQYDVTPDDRVSVLAFGALDFASEEDQGARRTLYDVRFHRLDARYYRRLSPTKRLRLAATLGDDRTLVTDPRAGASLFVLRTSSKAARADYVDRIDRRVELRAGADITVDESRGDTLGLDAPGAPPFTGRTDTALGARADVVLDLASFVTVVPGLRFDVYRAQGETVPTIEPRLSARFRVSESVTLSHEFGVAHQLPSFVVPVPGYRPELGNGLQRALQSSSGVQVKLPGGIVSTLTLFQNVLLNTTDRLSITALRIADSTIDDDARSLGHTFGAELLVKRDLTRRLGGFVAYTLSRSVRALGRAEGPAAVDRTHVLNIALGYDLGRNWRLGLRSFFYTGVPARVGYLAAAVSPPRTPPFYRFDWRLEKRWPFGEARYVSLIFEFLNTTLNREVPESSCNAFYCRGQAIGPVSVPSIGVEGAL
ncbi:MAG TPA: TonB family protein [Polyangiaceae bacterium]|nr:TonB family protein [Polyangiaceae bacterium]